ncbi:MAG TPA: ABC transporter substrate-binding protein, partial [Actinomycetes bacterium]|nr:ABC transporter substrate-binding protein [Actinomycetes bacterium]
MAGIGNRRTLVVLAVLALLLTACQGGETGGGGQAAGVKTDIGVTTDPCPGGNPDRDCIYLGVLSDLTEGPFRALAVPITEGQKAFWKRVNDQGGIGGRYDVDIATYTRDNKYNPQEHVAKYREIEPKILALGQTLGTPPTLAGLPLYKEADIIAAPASWWSGWEFEDVILESGYSYCTEAMNGLDWASEEFGKPDTVMAVHYPGDYGGDSAAGVAEWAKANGVDFQAETHAVQTTPNAQAGNQDAAVERILRADPDVVMVATGPAEMAEIVGKAAAQGFKGRFIGSVPTYNPALLKSEAAPAIKALYHFVSPWSPWGSDTPAHQAMEEAAGGKAPANDGYTFGWIWSYPLKAVLERAVQNGDLTRAG